MNIYIRNIGPSETLKIELAIIYSLIVGNNYWKLIIPTDFIPYGLLSDSLVSLFKFEINSNEQIEEYKASDFLIEYYQKIIKFSWRNM